MFAGFGVGFESERGDSIHEIFRQGQDDQGFEIASSDLVVDGQKIVLRSGEKNLDTNRVKDLSPAFMHFVDRFYDGTLSWDVVRLRCFLSVARATGGGDLVDLTPERVFGGMLRRIVHVPGLRGNPERSYNTSAVGDVFPGTFENYVASIIAAWQKASDERLTILGQALQALGLTWKIEANPLDATRVELLVARLTKQTKSARRDLVNIVDVGFGVSQVLPILVALLTAESGQLVYVEQPELHLHPRAQQALASILADAANRGVRVVVETHSSILLLAIQTLVAEGKLSTDKVKLHWFQRNARGATQVTSGDLDQLGAYGDWPVDFGEVEASVDNAYLDAVDARAFQLKKKNVRK